MNILTRRIREKNFMSNTMKENKMGTMPVNKLLINMALPMMISMLVQAPVSYTHLTLPTT